MELKKYSFEGEGMTRVYENKQWMVGIKNWKPANDASGINCLERHNLTDELFVLLSGECTLLLGEEDKADGKMTLKAEKMQKGSLYCIPKTMWHNTVTQKDTKLILIEDPSTCMDNSEIFDLSGDLLEEMKKLLG